LSFPDDFFADFAFYLIFTPFSAESAIYGSD